MFDVPPGHDGYTVGDEPLVQIEWAGIRAFAGFPTGIRSRVLATLLFTDVVGSTKLAARLGDGRSRELLSRYFERTRNELERFGSREVKRRPATACWRPSTARPRRSTVRRRSERSANRDGLHVRIGVHVGEWRLVGEDVRGGHGARGGEDHGHARRGRDPRLRAHARARGLLGPRVRGPGHPPSKGSTASGACPRSRSSPRRPARSERHGDRRAALHPRRRPDSEALSRITAELQRYERDYRVVCVPSTGAALGQLEALRGSGGRVAVVLAARGGDALTGEELLGRVTHLHPHARRALLLKGGWADEETADAIRRAMTRSGTSTTTS